MAVVSVGTAVASDTASREARLVAYQEFSHEMHQLKDYLETARSHELDAFHEVQRLQGKICELMVRVDSLAEARRQAANGARLATRSTEGTSLEVLAALLDRYEGEYAKAEASWRQSTLATADARAAIRDAIREHNGEATGEELQRYSGPHSLDAAKAVAIPSVEVSPKRRQLVRPAYPAVDPGLDDYQRLPVSDDRIRQVFEQLGQENNTLPMGTVVRYFEDLAGGIPFGGADFVDGTLAGLRSTAARKGSRAASAAVDPTDVAGVAVASAIGAATAVGRPVVSYEEFAYLCTKWARL